MDERPERPRRGRETFLALILIGLVGGGAFLYLVLVTGGFFVYVLLVAVGIGLFALLHYALWGRSLDAAVRHEREALEAEQRAEEERAAARAPWGRRF
jgi:hypothetical protein